MTDEDLKKIQEVIKIELKPIKDQLDDPNKGLDAINNKLNSPDKGLEAMNSKLDNLTADMVHVQTATKATYELVQHIYTKQGKQKKEIDEIKKQVGLL